MNKNMKKIMITLAGVLMALATHAQAVLQVETATGNTHYTYGKEATISFWGLPDGDEINRDLTLTVELDARLLQLNVSLHATGCSQFYEFSDVGFCMTEDENETPEYTNENISRKMSNEYSTNLRFSDPKPYYSLMDQDGDDFYHTLKPVEEGKTYYLKPYAVIGGQGKVYFGSEKSITIPWNIRYLMTADGYGGWDWYGYTPILTPILSPESSSPEYIMPSAEAWDTLWAKYSSLLGEEATDDTRSILTNEWFRHLTPSEASLMKAHTVAHYDNCLEGGEVYVIDKVCDELMPNLLKAAADIDLTHPNLNNYDNNIYYTRYCTVETVECDATWGIEGNQYVKTTPSTATSNPYVAYDLPFSLLPNRLYNVSVTIAPNTEDAEDEKPNMFRISAYQYNIENRSINVTGVRIPNPVTSTDETTDYNFTGGGKTLDTFTFTLDTHDASLQHTCMLQFESHVTTRLRDEYSKTIRIAQIHIAPVMEESVTGDTDMDGKTDIDDVQTVAAAVVLGNGSENNAEEQPSTAYDFTGDGETLIDDVVALVNYIQIGEFQPTSSKARVRRAATTTVPAFTTAQSLLFTEEGKATLSIDMSGLADYTAASFLVRMPQGVRIATDESGKPKMALGSAATAQHCMKAATLDDGQILSVACFATDNSTFAQDSGCIMAVELVTTNNTENNSLSDIALTNAMLTKSSLTSTMLDEYTIHLDSATGIEYISNATEENGAIIATYYTIDGRQIAQPQKGINIVRLKDGSMKKILVK